MLSSSTNNEQFTDRTTIEDTGSWDLYNERLRNNDNNQNQNQNQHRVLKKKQDNDGPIPQPQSAKKTQHGIMIDAGSQGTRIHVYEFHSRILSSKKDIHQTIHGQKLSFPTTDTRWTNRLKPGLDAFAFIDDPEEMENEVREYLMPLFDFVKTVLDGKKKHWNEYPIYLKATGGLRALPRPYRLRLINCVRTIMSDTKYNPFFFLEEHTRVISGEEEAIYGWAAVNFAKGVLIKESEGTGRVIETSGTTTYGVLELGGASTQIGFFEPNGDVMANLFKLQIGASKHWNVYVHSFLYFGINLAYDTFNAQLYTEAQQTTTELENSSSTNNNDTTTTQGGLGVYNPCLPGNSEYLFSSRIHALPDGTYLPLSNPNNLSIIEAHLYSSIMKNHNDRGNYELCNTQVQKILRKNANAWCNFAHDRDCSLAGIYQPPLPVNEEETDFGEFIATSNFYDIFDFLELAGDAVALTEIREKTKYICNMSIGELIIYNNKRNKPLVMEDLTEMCFRATFVGAYLIEGIGFPESYKINSADVINGQKLGWVLGSMIYEINTLPWEFNNDDDVHWIKDLEKLAPISNSRTTISFGGMKIDPLFVNGMFGVSILVSIVFCVIIVLRVKSRNHSSNYRNENEQQQQQRTERSQLLPSIGR